MKQKIVLVVAILAGLVAAFLTRAYLSAKNEEYRRLQKRFEAAHGTMEVLVLKRDLPGGSAVTRADLAVGTVPRTGLKGHALTEQDLSEVLGRKLVNGRRKNEILFWSDLEGGNPRGGGLAADIRRKMRAVSINASGAAAVSGMVKPNDHVDVIGTFSFPKAGADGKSAVQELVTCTILQNVLVLATGKETAKTMPELSFGGASYATVTLEVTPREAEMLVFAEQIRGRLSLTLRNRNDTSYETELPQVDFEKIKGEISELNAKRQSDMTGRR